MKYILDENNRAVPCNDITEWGQFFREKDRHVADDNIFTGDDENRKKIRVSTVFLGVNHQYNPDSPPLLFETMVFGGEYDRYRKRYTSWDEAMEGHEMTIGMIVSRGGDQEQ